MGAAKTHRILSRELQDGAAADEGDARLPSVPPWRAVRRHGGERFQVQQYLQIIQIILSVALVTAVLLQARGAALGSAFGGSDTIHNTRRGVDRLLFNVTIGIAALFIIVSVVLVRI